MKRGLQPFTEKDFCTAVALKSRSADLETYSVLFWQCLGGHDVSCWQRAGRFCLKYTTNADCRNYLKIHFGENAPDYGTFSRTAWRNLV